MSASSPCCSSTSPSAMDPLSDDSGVDVKPRDLPSAGGSADSNSRRNKRKSSEPRKRKDVLLMKRFRWEDTDEEDNNREEEEDNVFVVLDREERPSSGDSGCLVDTDQTKTKKREKQQRQWRKQLKAAGDTNNITAAELPFRQSVICKSENITSTAQPTCTTFLHHPNATTAAPLSLVKSKKPEDESDSATPGPSSTNYDLNSPGGRPRNYKSMSRQRRIEANARERTRVHTISAAFEALRRAVPAYAHNQKLSKLAILRIASAYIVALACLNDTQVSTEGEGLSARASIADCVESCTRTIQAEGRSRRRTSSKE